ncbi:LIC10173 family protein [Leptospira kirschneri]|uniref:LIC10173 family protein n=1 Tax=Leptospira kirschneri TaxID=29507 RepID=UPI00398AC4BE
MKIGHIKYLKNLIRSIQANPEPPETEPYQLIPNERIFEVHPPGDKFQELVPFCVVEHSPNQPERNGRRTERLESTVIEGVKNLQFLKEHYKQEYKYVLNFWLENIEQDILSRGDFTGSPLSSGIVDQTLIYIAKNKRYATSQGATVEIRPGKTALVTDPAEKLSLYKIYVEVIFKDGIFEVERVPTLASGTFEIEEPIEIVSSEEL